MRRANTPVRPRQKGVAIITAMLVVALGTITMVTITSRQQLDLQRERNEGVIQMARDLSASGERFAAALLYRDRQEALRENTDSLDDDWAQTIPPVPIDQAAIQGCIIDMQGRFNLNNLIDSQGNAVLAYVEQFDRLLGVLNIERSKAQAVIDWLDQDVNAQVPDGAEDDFYTSLDPAYRAANRMFASVSELQLVKGFDPRVETEAEDYELLVPHVAVLPVDDGPTPVNVNTATPEVLASVDDDYPIGIGLSRWETSAYEDYPECEDIFDLDAEATETLAEQDELTPYPSVEAFRAEAGGLVPPDPEDAAAPDEPEQEPTPRIDANGNVIPEPEDSAIPLSVASEWYEVRIDVIAEGLRLSQFSLLQRDGEGRTRIVRRSRDTI